MEQILIPDFLNEDADTIHERMLGKAPSNVSTIEGDIFWDTTRPSAEEKAKLKNIDMQELLRQANPQTATGKYLEYIGESHLVYKNLPTKSSGILTIEGFENTQIKIRTKICTPATDEEKSIEFETTEEIYINSSGMTQVPCICLTAGIIGNVQPNSITVLYKPINGVTKITNTEDFKGGTDIEEEEHYRDRVLEAEREDKLSGADSDYERWAKEVDGVGYAYVIEEWDGPGTVKILILDKNGQTATPELIKAVKDYIYPDKKEGQNRGGKAPVGATVTIDTPNILLFNIKAKYIFTEGFSKELVLADLKADIVSYLKKIKINGLVIYNSIHTIIGNYIVTAKGIDDFSNLTINGGSSNIKLIDQVAAIGDVQDEV